MVACGWCVGGGVKVIAVGGGVMVLHEVGIMSRPLVSCCNLARLQLALPEGVCPGFACCAGEGVGVGPGVWE